MIMYKNEIRMERCLRKHSEISGKSQCIYMTGKVFLPSFKSSYRLPGRNNELLYSNLCRALNKVLNQIGIM